MCGVTTCTIILKSKPALVQCKNVQLLLLASREVDGDRFDSRNGTKSL